MLSKRAIEEYRSIFKKEFGEEISYEEAEQQGLKLLRLFQIFARIDRRLKHEKKEKV